MCWPRTARGSASCAARRSSHGPRATPTSAPSSAGATPRRSAARWSWRSSTPVTGRGWTGPKSWMAWPPFSAKFPSVLRVVLAAVTAPPPPRPKELEQGVRNKTRRIDPWHVAPVAAAIVLAAVYLIWEPRTVDLAAHSFRADLFAEEGFTIWNGQWYGGHHTPAYSIISPPLAALLGPPLALALAAVASAALFPPLARGAFGDAQARWGSLWFGVATGTLLFTARLPFAAGVAFGLAALLALQRRR